MACPTVFIFPHHLISGKNFGREKILDIKSAFQNFAANFSETFFILLRTERDIIKNV
jgi:hypothetical protein